jgi:hypothetical protein
VKVKSNSCDGVYLNWQECPSVIEMVEEKDMGGLGFK